MTTDVNYGHARYLPLLYCSLPFRNWEEVGCEFVTDSDIEHDLAPLTREQCKARGLKHSSEELPGIEIIIEEGDRVAQRWARRDLKHTAERLGI